MVASKEMTPRPSLSVYLDVYTQHQLYMGVAQRIPVKAVRVTKQGLPALLEKDREHVDDGINRIKRTLDIEEDASF